MKPPTFTPMPRHKPSGFTLVEIMIVVSIMGILLAIAVPTWLRARNLSQQRVCQENQEKIDGAKHTWALETRAKATDSVTLNILYQADTRGYINYRPECPAGGSYTLGTVGTETTCNIIDPLDHNEVP